jgi:hypothetical protein
VTSAKECVDFLNSVAESWPAAGQKADILDTLVREYHPHTQTAVFEQAITLGTGSDPRETKVSHSPQQRAAWIPQSTQPIPVRQPTSNSQAQDTMLSSSFSSSYPESPWQNPAPYPQLQNQPQSFQDCNIM